MHSLEPFVKANIPLFLTYFRNKVTTFNDLIGPYILSIYLENKKKSQGPRLRL
jgi:hypothetical protein